VTVSPRDPLPHRARNGHVHGSYEAAVSSLCRA
jgi:hypothetical protein